MRKVAALMRRLATIATLLLIMTGLHPPAVPAAEVLESVRPLEVYGAWHCSDDFCTWGSVRDLAEFDQMNHWLIDRGDGRPSVNLVVLAFVHPLRLLHQTTDTTTLNGVPRGMTPEIVNYFTSRGVRVMLSIGGITYTQAWDQALAEDPTQLGHQAAAVAGQLGVGIEIDYEQNTDPNLTGLQAFIDAYRSVHPYDSSGANPPARLTIDVAAGDRWLIDLNRKATADWLRTDVPVLDYANAMVPARQPNSADRAILNWQEHVDGKPQFSPPVPPLAPAKFTGSLYIAGASRNPFPECINFPGSLQNSTGSWVQTVVPNGAGSTPGILGYMFWAAESPSDRGVTTQPPNTCQGGVGAGATTYPVPIPMPALRRS
jgi:hypothetical protein